MIADTLDNFGRCLGEGLDDVLAFLRSLDSSTPEGERELRGKDIFARVMSYQTKTREQTAMEAHRRYADVQVVLSGCEVMEWHPLAGLKPVTPYAPDSDAVFLEKPTTPQGQVVLTPGRFAVFFPQDAHMGQIALAGPEQVRKVVVKISMELLQGR